jgi:hypothetical protein
MTRGTQSGAERVGPASKRQGPLFGREPKESSRVLCRTLFWEEPEKQRAAVPQDAGKDPERVPESAGEHILLERHRRVRSDN